MIRSRAEDPIEGFPSAYFALDRWAPFADMQARYNQRCWEKADSIYDDHHPCQYVGNSGVGCT